MFQSFEETSRPDLGPARLAALRRELAREGLDGFIVPRADAHQGEYVAPRDDRLAWLTGFTGSAGSCVALNDCAGVFVDSRYRVQVRNQVSQDFTPVDWPEIDPADWINDRLPAGARIGFDPWLLPLRQVRDMQMRLGARRLVATRNLVDSIWSDQPDPPLGPIFVQPDTLAGETRDAKLARIGAGLAPATATVLTLPDSIAWLLNIRGRDILRNPVPHAFAILHADGSLDLFIAPEKCRDVDLGTQVRIAAPNTFLSALADLTGPVRVDPTSVPMAVVDALEAAQIPLVEATDPCILPKACKTNAELAGSRAAHLRDAAAMVRFLAWLDLQAPGNFTEIDVVRHLEGERRATNALRDISFDTISGSGPNGAIVHYRVTEASNRTVGDGELLLVDSGGQYQDGTTDITRTVAIGNVGDEERDAFTRVLQGMIALSKLRWPKGLTGRDIDVLARTKLWEAGLDYGHGTGHGVGSYLCVHEGPQRIARTGTQALLPGMILSNEPGYYREGAFGIRIENLIVVEHAPHLPNQTVGEMLRFETLTWVPIDRRLIRAHALAPDERAWLNSYHSEILERVGPLLDGPHLTWLKSACAPL